MIIIGEKINGSIPVVAKAIAEKDAEFIKQRAIAQDKAGATYIDCCASVPEAEEVETTAFDSDAKETQPGAIDNGTFDLSLQITDAKVARVLNAWQANSDMLVFDQVLYMKSGKPAFSQMGIGYIQAFHITGGLNEIVTAQATIRVSGALYDVTHKTPDKTVVGTTHSIPQDLKDSTSVFQAGA